MKFIIKNIIMYDKMKKNFKVYNSSIEWVVVCKIVYKVIYINNVICIMIYMLCVENGVEIFIVCY